MSSVFVIGTGDTKAAELEYVRSVIQSRGVAVTSVDVGTSGHDSVADVTPVCTTWLTSPVTRTTHARLHIPMHLRPG